MSNSKLVDDIENCLPQTQCGLCSYDGCKPYAEAMAAGDAKPNLCPPGGLDTLAKLGKVLNCDTTPYEQEVAANYKPAQVAVIREHECIGCKKCIHVCPTDAIIGAAKLMHTVVSKDCTGCELCVPACPMDCIDLIQVIEPLNREKETEAQRWKQLHEERNQRANNKSVKERAQHKTAKLDKNARQQAILDALARVKKK